eukprot:TRINITY_DN12393_c0_g2_i1.p2 TRINITY_DN12393_c0_g2~~TRINITY_DN12393_c0_g2_i1.p2  ORF type:complete len:536 (-),score=59.15 TRINITY_DN12393_c0_g2_i1:823-2385(-)
MIEFSNKYSIDEAFSGPIGEFGIGQQTLFTIAASAWIPAALQTLVMVFTSEDPVHLKLWDCTDPNNQICTALKSNPDNEAVTHALCDPARSFKWYFTQKQTSIISDFDLLCEPELASFSSSAFFIGFLFGAGIFGQIADSRGRKSAMFLACIFSFVFGVLNSLAFNYWIYIFLRALTGVGVAGIGLVSFVISTEPLGNSYRGFAGIMSQCFFALGQIILAFIAYIIPNWRYLNLICAFSSGFYILFLPMLLESPRWLLVQGKISEATEVLQKIAKSNNTQPPTGQLNAISQSHGDTKNKISDVLKHSKLRHRFLILLYSWAVVSACYFGISLSLGALKGSQYLIFFYMGLAELFSYFLAAYTVEKIGRNPTLSWNFVIGGISCIATGLATQSSQIIFSLFGKFGIAIAFNTLFVYTTELFPTVVRSGTLGVMSLGARVGGIFAPQIVALSHILGEQTPFMIFGFTTIIAGFLLMTLPETVGQPLPDTFEDVNHMSKKSGGSSTYLSKWVNGRSQDLEKLV